MDTVSTLPPPTFTAVDPTRPIQEVITSHHRQLAYMDRCWLQILVDRRHEHDAQLGAALHQAHREISLAHRHLAAAAEIVLASEARTSHRGRGRG